MSRATGLANLVDRPIDRALMGICELQGEGQSSSLG
jgi:hypothetical protein